MKNIIYKGKEQIVEFTIFLAITYGILFNTITVYGENNKINVSARAAIAIDMDSGLVLYEKNAYEVIPMASTTKIMTALVALKHGNLDKKIIISKKAASIGGSKVKYRAKEEITLRELLYGLLFKSGNDAAIAISEDVGGSLEKFINLMNEEVVNMGLTNTHFESPHGLDKPMHYTTAYDLAKLTCIAKRNETFNKLVRTKSIGKGEHNFTRDYNNINKLLYQNPNCTGVKTGYTANAGKCLVSSFNINNKEIVVVTLNCTERWNESNKIFNYVKDEYKFDNIRSANENILQFTDLSGNAISGYIKENIVLPKNSYSKYDEKVNLNDFAMEDLNIAKDNVIGLYKILKDDKEVYSAYIYNDCAINNKENIWYKINKNLRDRLSK